MQYYKLQGREVVPATREEFAEMFENDDARRVGRTTRNGVTVSTVFLGLDHGFGETAQPVVFETMVFGGPDDEYQERCCTYAEAEAMHERACQTAFRSRRSLQLPE